MLYLELYLAVGAILSVALLAIGPQRGEPFMPSDALIVLTASLLAWPLVLIAAVWYFVADPDRAAR